MYKLHHGSAAIVGRLLRILFIRNRKMPTHTSTKVVLRFVNGRISAVPRKCRARVVGCDVGVAMLAILNAVWMQNLPVESTRFI